MNKEDFYDTRDTRISELEILAEEQNEEYKYVKSKCKRYEEALKYVKKLLIDSEREIDLIGSYSEILDAVTDALEGKQL